MFSVAADLSTVPPFGVAGSAVVLVTAGYLMALAPLGRRRFRRLRAARRTDPGALVAFYRRNVTGTMGLLLPVAVVLLVVPGLQPAQLGLAWPHGPSAGRALDLFVGLVASVLFTGMWWRRMARRGQPVPRPRRLETLLPATHAEYRWACAVSISAGICEEVVFRGLLVMAGIAAGWPPIIAALAAGALFGGTHLYQGRLGMLLTTALGLALTWFFVATGSLLFPIVLHILIDLRGLVMVPAVTTSAEPVQRSTA